MLAAVLLTAGCAASTGAANSGGGTVTTGTTGGGSAAAQSFEAFLASVSAATYQDYANEPGARVRDSSAFQQMRAYILSKYDGAQVARSFSDGSGAVYDCVRQPSATAGATAPADTTTSAGACPPGTVPTRRITLSDLVRFPTLQQFFSKSPGGTGQLPLPPSTTK
jgi:nucleoside-diphosphate-sugar epimerase